MEWIVVSYFTQNSIHFYHRNIRELMEIISEDTEFTLHTSTNYNMYIFG